MHPDDHSRPRHGSIWISWGTNMLVQHVHLVSCWCNDLEALANFNTQWMDYNVLHFPRCTSRSQNFGERKRNKKNPESDLCWGSLAGAFHGNHDLYCPVCHRYRCILQLGFRTTSFTFRNWVPLPNSRATPPL